MEELVEERHSIKRKIATLLMRCLLIWLIFSLSIVCLYKYVPVYFTPLMGIRIIESLVENKPVTFRKEWVPLEKMSTQLPLAVVAAEDQLFPQHHGFDLKAIRNALQYNAKNKQGRLRGASTISQQTAKNVFLWPNRDWIRKSLEVYFTVLIELIWGKERIIEVYLNVIEMGDGIYGVEAASRKYFSRSAKALTAYQSASIAAILPNPMKYSATSPSTFVADRIRWIQLQMRNLGKLGFQ